MSFLSLKNNLIRPTTPRVRLVDLRSDITNQTTYSFTNIPTTPAMSGANLESGGKSICLADSLRRMLVAVVHSEDSQTSWLILSSSLGGVAADYHVDRGGTTSAINSGMVIWSSDSLADITNTDFSITFSEAITSCAVAFLEITGLGLDVSDVNGAYAAVGTGLLSATITDDTSLNNNPAGMLMKRLAIFGSTCVTGGGTELFSVAPGTAFNTSTGGVTILYADSNAEIDYAGGYCIADYTAETSAVGKTVSLDANWSGSGAGDILMSTFYY